MEKEAGSDGPSTTKGGGDSCLDSGELAQLEISGEMAQLEMVKRSPPTVKSGLLEGERRAARIRFEPTSINMGGLATLGVSWG